MSENAREIFCRYVIGRAEFSLEARLDLGHPGRKCWLDLEDCLGKVIGDGHVIEHLAEIGATFLQGLQKRIRSPLFQEVQSEPCLPIVLRQSRRLEDYG